MNDVINFLNSHASVRKFTSREISSEDEATILSTAQRSPTSSNLQAYSAISIRDRIKKQELACLAGNQKHVEECPLFIVFCADLYRLAQLCRLRGYEYNGHFTEAFIIATVDAALVAGRALMAAQALGMGGVMVGGIRNQPEQAAQLLGLPELTYPVMGMSLGFAETTPTIKPRLPRDAIFFDEQYDTARFSSAVAAYDETIRDRGYLEGREVEPENYPDFNGMYSWSEHCVRRMASINPATLRPHMLEFLRARGFLQK